MLFYEMQSSSVLIDLLCKVVALLIYFLMPDSFTSFSIKWLKIFKDLELLFGEQVVIISRPTMNLIYR